MSGRKRTTSQPRLSGARRLQFESLEERVVLSASSLAEIAPAVQIDLEEPVAVVADLLVSALPYYRFNELTAAQVPLLTTAQIATIPNETWFRTMAPDVRAAFNVNQVRALDVADVHLSALTTTQVSWLTNAQLQTLTYWDFKYLAPAQIPVLTTAQIATIPDLGIFTQLSNASRAALTAPQIQALAAPNLRLDLLTASQIAVLTPTQIRSLNFYQFKYLSATQTPSLSAAQIATIPDAGTFSQWTDAARQSLTVTQVQALRVGVIGMSWLTPTQRTWLSDAQIRSVTFWDFKYLSPSQIPSLTPAQIATIPDLGIFATLSDAARAALTAPQIQALPAATLRLDLLTAAQVASLTTAQILTLDFYQYQYLSATQTPLLSAAQIATIPDAGTFVQWSEAARAALSVGQVQALRVGVVGMSLLTSTQRTWISVAQVQSLKFTDFQYLGQGKTPFLTLAQVASIPNIGSFGAWTSSARAALTASQIQALNIATVRLDLLTPQQVAWITIAQIRVLDFYGFSYLDAAQTPYLTLDQIATIPDTGSFISWSPAARAALTAPQVQVLNVVTIRIDLLTAAQVSSLTSVQVRALSYSQFPLLAPAQIPLLTNAQIASIPDIGTFIQWSPVARLALTQPQIQSLKVATVRLSLLTSAQIAMLTTAQVQSLDHFDFAILNASQIPLLTTAQFASVPNDYYLRNWSDQQLASMTRPQILALPYTVYNHLISLQTVLQPPANYQPVGSGHDGHDASNPTTVQVFNLVPIQTATHVTLASGNWSNPAIWRNGIVPSANARVLISSGTTVRFDAFMNTPIFTLRVDGTFEFATNVNTQLKVDTVVITTDGAFHVGTAAAPIADNVTARVLIADNGPINTAWDPFLWSRGIINRGEMRIYGRTVTPYTSLAVEPKAGATTLTLGAVPLGWRVGDEIVVGGTNPYSADFGSDRVRILAINGTTLTVEPLRYAHTTPAGQGLSIYVANLNRNVQFMAEDSSVTAERPHFAIIHNPDTIIQYLGVYGFGRTDKSVPINDPVVTNGVLRAGTGTNARARYAIHFHHTGVDPLDAPAIVGGSVVVDSAGWGYVNHSSNVLMENNVSFGVVGAGFVTEDGNEIGTMRGNLAMNEIGSGEHILAREDNHDFGHGGHGFWFQGPGVDVSNNIAIGSADAAFAYLTQSSKNLIDAVNLNDPSLAGGRQAVPVGTVPLDKFDGNISSTAKTGLEIWHHMTFMPDGLTVINNFTSWNNRYAGIDLLYTGNVVILNPKLLGNSFYDGVGIATNRLTHDVTIVNPRIEGFEIGIDVPVRQNSAVYGGYIAAVQALYIEKGHDTMRTANIAGLVTASPTAAQLRGRTHYAVYGTANYDFEYPAFLDRRVDSLLAQDSIRIAINSAIAGQLYFYEQTPNYVPFPADKAAGYVPSSYLNKTNGQLRSELGLSFGGDLLPTGLLPVPGTYGFMRYRF